MSNLYNRLQELCEEKGVSGYRMCKDVGIQPSIMTDLKMGRRASMKVETAQKVADYFGVTVGYLLGEGKEKAPTQEGEREITFDDFTYAMQNESKELTEMDKQILLSMAKQLNDARKKRNGESG
ncbi:helix-turn-helix transcriptional regulator [Flavonifractor plautii]|uniref:helix-turn-helix domain-containing protein n=1 Tax=Oscillospiraceae TaxID=216572 RepID=UPI001D008C36|nr:helix-turn-helix transcriptional regulator [Flavonifractor plautii]MCB5853734.1 helix-turn-helix transcriptional regulator [Flavonifractor plautii]